MLNRGTCEVRNGIVMDGRIYFIIYIMYMAIYPMDKHRVSVLIKTM